MLESRKEYKSLDVFKFIFAFLVVMIHAKPFMDISEKTNWFISNTIFNLAVPFFFITSGFLIFEKLKYIDTYEEKKLAIKKYVIRLLKMYCIYSIIWLPLKILGWYTSGGIDSNDILIWFKQFFLTGKTGDALWYLLAVTICAIVVSVVTYYGKKRFVVLFIGAGLLYTIGVLISSYYEIFSGIFFVKWYYSIFEGTENALLEGLFLFVIGAGISNYSINLELKKVSLCFAFSLLIMFGEVFLVYTFSKNYNGTCKLFTLPVVSALLFLTIIQLPISWEGKRCAKLRDYSTLIYVSHCLFIRMIGIILGILKLHLSYSLLFFLTSLFSLSFAVAVRHLAKVKNYKIFKLLY